MHKLEKQVTGIINQFIIVIFRVGGPNERIRLATNDAEKIKGRTLAESQQLGHNYKSLITRVDPQHDFHLYSSLSLLF